MAVETVAKTRLRNMKFLFERFKEEVRESWPSEPDKGMLKRFAERLDTNAIYLSQIMNGHKDMGTATRKNYEARLGLQEGWLDTDHTQEAIESDDDAKAFRDSVMALYNQSPESARGAFMKIFSHLAAGKPIEEIAKQGKGSGKK